MEEVRESFNYLTSRAFIGSVIVLLIMFVILHVIKQYLVKKVAYAGKDSQHINTFYGVVFNVLQYLVIILAVVIVFSLHGVNVASILAGLGIMATIIGLALQDTLKDIIAGISIYSNNFYKVGDMVRWNGEECDVKYFSARVTKFKSIYTNSTYTVNNSLINNIEKIKDFRVEGVAFDYDVDRKKIDKVMNNVVKYVEKNAKSLKSITYLGVIMLNDTGATFAIGYSSPAHKFLPIKMMILNTIYDECKKAGISPSSSSDLVVRTKTLDVE